MPSLSAFGPGFYETYRQRTAENDQAGMRDLQQIAQVLQIKNAVRQQREDEQLKAELAQSGGDVDAVIKGALRAGRADIAARLAPLAEVQRKAATPKVHNVSPGGQLIDPSGKILATVPFKPTEPRPPSEPELIKLQNAAAALPAGDPRKLQIEAAITKMTTRPPAAGRMGAGAAPPDIRLTPDALDMRAWQYLSGDPRAMANLGRGAQGVETIAQITNRAAELNKQRGGTAQEIGRRTAEFRANANSLSNLTKSYDAIVAFEQTAIRNGEILKTLASKVDATGVPAIERWVRAGRKATGDADVAQFMAQLQVYRTEAARILTNPNLTAQLTDQARKEVEEFLQGGSSASQITGVVDLLKRDFGNRKHTLEQQIGDVRERIERNISPGQQQARPPQPATPVTAPTPAPAQPGAWTPEKEQRYQELLRKRGS